VKPFDLGSKDTVDIDRNAELLFEHLGKLIVSSGQSSGTHTSLVILLDRVEGLAELGILGHREELGELLRVDQPVITTQSVGSQCGQLRVALQEPSVVIVSLEHTAASLHLPSRRDAVGDVGEEVSTLELDKVPEDRGLQELAVELGDTVDLERSHNSQEASTESAHSERRQMVPTHAIRTYLGEPS
jgi:hypothetical protein